MYDNVVLDNIALNNLNPSEEELLAMEAMSVKPRFLDKPPKRIKLQSVKSLQKYGCYEEFIILYNHNAMNLVLNTPCQLRIDIGGGNSFVSILDPEVYLVIKTLAQRSFTMIQLLSEACSSIFKKICTLKTETITRGDLCRLLLNYIADDYYEQQTIKAILDCLDFENVGDFFMHTTKELAKPNYSKVYDECVNWVTNNFSKASEYYSYVKSKKIPSKICVLPEFNKYEAMAIAEIAKVNRDLCIECRVII